MDTTHITTLVQATVDGTMPFPNIVGELIAQGVEYYYVDFATHTFTAYDADGHTQRVALRVPALPAVAPDFDLALLKAAITDSQLHGQPFAAFCQRAACAGVMGYFAFLRGQRVTYLGRTGDQHTEWFPGAKQL